MKVYLDGTENGSDWREKLIQDLKKLKIEYFDPSLENRSKRSYMEEIDQKNQSKFHIYVITPRMDDFENISELIEDSNKNPSKTIFSFLLEDGEIAFNSHQVKSLERVGEMMEKNGGKWCKNFREILTTINP